MKYSGKFVLRIDPSLHKILVDQAEDTHTSLNQFCRSLIESGLKGHPKGEGPLQYIHEASQPILQKLVEKFGNDLVGMAAFGSRVSGGSTSASDLDLLIVLSDKLRIKRSFYAWWEEHVPQESPFEINPHFTHLPSSPDEAGSLWLEVATSSLILWQNDSVMEEYIRQVKDKITQGHYRRYWSNGHPYWLRNPREK